MDAAIPAPTAAASIAPARTSHPVLDAGGTVTLLILFGVFLAPTLAWVEWSRPVEVTRDHPFELRMLLCSGLLPLLLAILQIGLHIRRHGGPALRGNRDFYPRTGGVAGRVARAHANAIESLAPFAAVILAAHAMNVSNRWTIAASTLFLAARMTHALTYILGVTIIRSSAYYAGWIATVTIAVAVGWQT